MSTSTVAQKTTPGRATLLTGLILAVIAFQLNATMLNPAVQQMQTSLSATVAQVGLTSAFFFLSKAIFQVFMPRLSDMAGRRRMLMLALAILTVGTVICIIAPSIEWLYVGRAIQGACGPVFTIALLILREACDTEKEYGTKMGLIIAINGGVGGLDVILGGWMADHWGFRSIFIFTLVVSVLAMIAVWLWVQDSAPSKGEKMDWLGVALISIAVIGFSWAAGGDPLHKFPSRWNLYDALVGLIALIVFVLWEKKASHPLIPAGQLSNRAIWAMPLTTILTLTSVMAIVNLMVPSFAQNKAAGWAMTATMASLLFMAPYSLIGWLVGPFAGRFAPRYGYRTVLQFGILTSGAIMVVMALCGLSNRWILGMLLFLLGITYSGISNVMLNGMGILLSPPEAPGLLPGLNGASFGIGASLSFSIIGRTIAQGSPKGSTSVAGYSHAMWLSVGLFVATFLVTCLLPQVGKVSDTSAADAQ